MDWIFGYGSLMWNPGFAWVERSRAVLRGYHRAYLMYSTRNRGSPASLGLVLSLAPGGECVGTAYRADPAHLEETHAYLDKREGVGRAHLRVTVPVTLETPQGPRVVNLLTYLPVHTYSNYIGGVPLSRQAELVAIGCGNVGTSYDYLRLLLEELQQMGVHEPSLERLFAAARELRRRQSPARDAAPHNPVELPLAGK